jgi:hypothetical protein
VQGYRIGEIGMMRNSRSVTTARLAGACRGHPPLLFCGDKGVDGWDKPGHDDEDAVNADPIIEI